MELLETKKENTTIFQVKGRLDTTTSPEVERKILDAITSGQKHIVLDFSTLEYISSAGIRVLVHSHKKLEHEKGSIALAALPKSIENVLYITGFLPYFKIFETQEKAIEALNKNP
ncbi:MAG: putative anti-sigma factor antagonist BtrV [Chlamydiales bacterium]|nr:putative anti-sigma factor antagonist BtrV [Chlamydiales bacterium]MCH9620086.1 putative anti-sigma factor antagonist BtrV [Chlamydiales bacterium]MCH9623039.1 putative anti-sigma factor antagonist BtrV [Chlamydiales bacterium]